MSSPETTAAAAAPADPGIAPLDPPYPPDAQAWLTAAMPKDSPVPPLALFRVFARHLPLAEAMHPLGRWFLTSGGGTASLTVRQRELVILRVTALCGALYEWAVHVQSYGDRAALDAAQIAATRGAGPDAACWTAQDRLLLRAVDALHRDCDIPDALWPDLQASFDVPAQLEILFLSGWYRTISQVVNASRVAPEPWAPLPEVPTPA